MEIIVFFVNAVVLTQLNSLLVYPKCIEKTIILVPIKCQEYYNFAGSVFFLPLVENYKMGM